MSEGTPSVVVTFVPAGIEMDDVVDCIETRTDEQLLVMSDQPHRIDSDVSSISSQAHRHLTTAGWVVPEQMIHAGQPISTVSSARFSPEAWFEQYYRDVSTGDTVLQAVRSPAALVETLEASLADGIIPSETGWIDTADRWLSGDRDQVTSRLDAFTATVSDIDQPAVMEAFQADDLYTEFRSLLTDYLSYRLERGAPSDTQLAAYAAGHSVGPNAPACLLLSEDIPAATAIAIAQNSAKETLYIAVDSVPRHDGLTAWPIESAGLRTRVQAACHDVPADEIYHGILIDTSEGYQIDIGSTVKETRSELLDRNQLSRTPVVIDVSDPISTTGEVVEQWYEDAEEGPLTSVETPADLSIVVPTRRHARRLARLLWETSVPFERTGTVEVCKTHIAVLSIAWLRVIEGRRPDRGWAVLLEDVGCSPGDIDAWLESNERPAALASFKSDLGRLPNGPAVIAAIAQRYNVDEECVQALISAIDTAGEPPSTLETLDRLLEGFAAETTVQLADRSTDAVTIEVGRPKHERSALIHVDLPRESSIPAVTYRPPLGIHRTREIVTQDGHTIEMADPSWCNLDVLQPDVRDYRRWRIRESASWATDVMCIVGDDPPIDSESITVS